MNFNVFCVSMYLMTRKRRVGMVGGDGWGSVDSSLIDMCLGVYVYFVYFNAFCILCI